MRLPESRQIGYEGRCPEIRNWRKSYLHQLRVGARNSRQGKFHPSAGHIKHRQQEYR